jgi:hypothetical protein
MKRTPWLVLLGTAALLAGCGGPRPAPVRGVVRYNGKPMCPGMLHFLPVGGEGKQAYAALQQDGSFTVKTQGEGDGALPGVYKVTVSRGLGNPPDLADYDTQEKTPITVEVPANGLENWVLDVPLKRGKGAQP